MWENYVVLFFGHPRPSRLLTVRNLGGLFFRQHIPPQLVCWFFYSYGGLAERSIAMVLKTMVGVTLPEGSNPSPSEFTKLVDIDQVRQEYKNGQ